MKPPHNITPKNGYPSGVTYRLIRAAALAVLVVVVIALSLALVLHLVTGDHASAALVGCLAVLAIAIALLPPAHRPIPVLAAGSQAPTGSFAAAFPDSDRPPERRHLLLC